MASRATGSEGSTWKGLFVNRIESFSRKVRVFHDIFSEIFFFNFNHFISWIMVFFVVIQYKKKLVWCMEKIYIRSRVKRSRFCLRECGYIERIMLSKVYPCKKQAICDIGQLWFTLYCVDFLLNHPKTRGNGHEETEICLQLHYTADPDDGFRSDWRGA